MRRATIRVLALILLGFGSQLPIQAGLLDPNAFASLGAFPTLAGNYSFDTNTYAGAPRLNLAGGGFITGVFSNGVAVFDFDSVAITAGMHFSIQQHTTGDNAVPLAILSRGDIIISSALNLDAYQFFAGAGGYLGVPQGYNPNSKGGGPGGGYGPGGGGGFGGAGGASPNAAGGSSYGDLSQILQGGSGGGNSNSQPSIYGGGGGGALELGALGNIVISAAITANGAGGNATTNSISGGGGSGGGLLIHGYSVTLTATGQLRADGGSGGSIEAPYTAGGGGGGGGRILISTGPGGFHNQGGALSAIGGAGGSGSFGAANGQPGRLGEIRFLSTAVPEPSSIVMLGLGAFGVGGLALRHRRSNPIARSMSN